MGSVLVEKSSIDDITFIKDSLTEIKKDMSMMKTYFSDAQLSSEEKKDIEQALIDKKKGKLLKMNKIF